MFSRWRRVLPEAQLQLIRFTSSHTSGVAPSASAKRVPSLPDLLIHDDPVGGLSERVAGSLSLYRLPTLPFTTTPEHVSPPLRDSAGLQLAAQPGLPAVILLASLKRVSRSGREDNPRPPPQRHPAEGRKNRDRLR